MSSKKLFITGGTGFIGGSVLTSVVDKFPSLQITALLRSSSTEFTTRYPEVKVVLGDFNSSDIIARESEKADIVIHTGDIDHAGCAASILSGLSKKSTPGYLIHLTGTGCIADIPSQIWDGSSNPRIWNDISDLQEIYDLPDTAYHHKIDREIMDFSSKDGLVKTAIICPPDIYGQNTGIGKRSTFLVPEYVKHLVAGKEPFYLGKGENWRAVTHIDDVVDLFVILIDNAVRDGGEAQWGKEGFYFAVSDEIQWKSAARATNDLGIKQNWVSATSKPVSWTKEQVGSLMPEKPGVMLYLWGSNSRAYSERARRLGWEPKGKSFWESLEEDVKIAVRGGKGVTYGI